jgi:hypothetical protein
MIKRHRSFDGRGVGILLRSFEPARNEASDGAEGKWYLASEAEQLGHEFCFCPYKNSHFLGVGA